jgi:DNA-binding MarR family transcriptional regulator
VPEDETLAEAFWAVARRLRHLTHETVAPLGVTPAQARAVNVLTRQGSMRLSDLALHLRIAARSATDVVDALEGLGLATRTPDPSDRRATLIALTSTGKDVAEALHTARLQETKAFFSTLDEADRQALASILGRLRQP